MTCATDADTDVKFWNLEGRLLQTINTNQVRNFHCVGSVDNRYIAVAAYTPEIKVQSEQEPFNLRSLGY